MKSQTVIAVEASLYVTIAVGAVFADFLISDREVTPRSVTAASVVALVAGANALKAFLSQSMSQAKDEPTKTEIVNTPDNPIPTTDQDQ